MLQGARVLRGRHGEIRGWLADEHGDSLRAGYRDSLRRRGGLFAAEVGVPGVEIEDFGTGGGDLLDPTAHQPTLGVDGGGTAGGGRGDCLAVPRIGDVTG